MPREAERLAPAPRTASRLAPVQHPTATAPYQESELDRVGAARRALEVNPTWYHSIELAPGVVSPGQVDHRALAAKILPDDLSGLRALDIGTFDGFWAFEMEKRGAEVVAIDVETIDAAEWPPLNRERLLRETAAHALELGRGFRLAKELLGSKVERVVCNAYDLTPEAIGGPVDFIFEGAVLLHLRDPVAVLERAHGALKPNGRMLIWEEVSVLDTLRAPRRPVARFSPLLSNFTWWLPNYAALVSMPLAAGFAEARRVGIQRTKGSNRGMRKWYCAIEARPRAQPVT
jgi:SAM-dependent methyltransferase